MEMVLLTIALLYFDMECGGIGVRCRYLVEEQVEKQTSQNMSIRKVRLYAADDFIVRHTYTVSPKTDSMEQVKPNRDDGETIKESEVTFEDDKSSEKVRSHTR